MIDVAACHSIEILGCHVRGVGPLDEALSSEFFLPSNEGK